MWVIKRHCMGSKLIMITGSYPPMRCGVGDYTSHLVEGLARDMDMTLVTSAHESLKAPCPVLTVKGWGLMRMPALALAIARLRPGVAHLQYPTLGYGFKLGPQLLAMLLRLLGIKVVVTIHEFKHARTLRKLASVPLLLCASSVVFTAASEAESVCRWLSMLGALVWRKADIVPVGPGIFPGSEPSPRASGGPLGVAFFGLFYPGRCIEQVIEAVAIASGKLNGMRLMFIGDMHPRYRDYYEQIRSEAGRSLPDGAVSWVIGREPDELREVFGGVDVFILPYPDGASFRRTSLLSAMAFGVPVITTRGDDTPEELRHGHNVMFAGGPHEMARCLQELAASPELYATVSRGALLKSQNFSWQIIASGHRRIYDKLS